MKTKRAISGFLLSFVFLLFFLYMVSGVQWFYEKYLPKQNSDALLGSISSAAQNIQPENNTEDYVQPAPVPEIDAESAISVESNLSDLNKVLFEKSSDAKLAIASLTKLMTAVVVLDNYDLTKNITVDEAADSQDPMKQDVRLGDTMPAESFLEIMLVKSSNKSAYTLSEVIGEQEFVNFMNQKAKDLGLENTFFADPTGLSPKNISTANDLAKLAEYILKNYSKIADISRVKELDVPKFGKVANTDELLGQIPEIVCSKTGFTTQAKGCLLLVVSNPKNNDYIINIILGADDRFSEMKKLIDWQNQVCK